MRQLVLIREMHPYSMCTWLRLDIICTDEGHKKRLANALEYSHILALKYDTQIPPIFQIAGIIFLDEIIQLHSDKSLISMICFVIIRYRVFIIFICYQFISFKFDVSSWAFKIGAFYKHLVYFTLRYCRDLLVDSTELIVYYSFACFFLSLHERITKQRWPYHFIPSIISILKYYVMEFFSNYFTF